MISEFTTNIIHWDVRATLAINQAGNVFWDQVMWWVSLKWTWVPLYAFLLFYAYKQKKEKVIWGVLMIVLLIFISDQTSVHFFKNTVQRLRPCHDPHLQELIRLVNNYCGGKFGFLSSHASNSFALAVFYIYWMRLKIPYSILLIFWATLVSISRVYLGAHFVLDIMAGALWGYFLAKYLYLFAQKKLT